MSQTIKKSSGEPRKIKEAPKEDKTKRYTYPEYSHEMCVKLAAISAAAYRTKKAFVHQLRACLLYTSPSPRDKTPSRMPSSA